MQRKPQGEELSCKPAGPCLLPCTQELFPTPLCPQNQRTERSPHSSPTLPGWERGDRALGTQVSPCLQAAGLRVAQRDRQLQAGSPCHPNCRQGESQSWKEKHCSPPLLARAPGWAPIAAPQGEQEQGRGTPAQEPSAGLPLMQLV